MSAVPPAGRRRFLAAAAIALAAALAGPAARAERADGAAGGAAWLALLWHGEAALQADYAGWRAIVSLDRGRLVHFGPEDGEENLLFAPVSRDDAYGWGGHRVWLGPQAEWPAVWPPAAAWEQSAAASVLIRGATLELTMPDSGDGWARLVRTYGWGPDGLACGVRLRGGSHAAQVLQILQVRAEAVVHVEAKPDPTLPHGFALLEIGQANQVRREFSWPAGASRGAAPGALVLRPSGVVEKLAFVPQPLRATLGGCELILGPTLEQGRPVGAVDDGFTTQVYLAREGVPFLELEQLSARFAAGEEASATVLLRARRLP